MPQVGERVLLGKNRLPGVLRFVGPTSFASGLWSGVELASECGKNDGSVDGIRYFVCEKPGRCGVFVRPEAVASVDPVRDLAPSSGAPDDIGAATLGRARGGGCGALKEVARRSLIEAVEGRNISEIRARLPEALRLGVERAELDVARRVLEAEAQRLHSGALESLDTRLRQLAEAYELSEARLFRAEQRAIAAERVTAELQTALDSAFWRRPCRSDVVAELDRQDKAAGGLSAALEGLVRDVREAKARLSQLEETVGKGRQTASVVPHSGGNALRVSLGAVGSDCELDAAVGDRIECKLLGCGTGSEGKALAVVGDAQAKLGPPLPLSAAELERSFARLWDVKVDLSSGEHLGISAHVMDSAHMRVSAVSGGVIAQWNKAHPELAVMPDDIILSVNGRNCNVQDLLKTCGQEMLLVMELARPWNAQACEPKETDRSHREAWDAMEQVGRSLGPLAVRSQPDLACESCPRQVGGLGHQRVPNIGEDPAMRSPRSVVEAWGDNHFSIALRRERKGVTLGLNVDGTDGRSLLINKVSEGLVNDWNMLNPDKVVRAGDRVVSVNGCAGSAIKLTEMLKFADDFEMVIVGSPGTSPAV